jgi:hypothetical protein
MPAVKALALWPSMEAIIMKIKAELGDRAELWSNVILYGCQQYSGAKLKDIGEHRGISDVAVSQASQRVACKAETDPQRKQILDRMRHFSSTLGVELCPKDPRRSSLSSFTRVPAMSRPLANPPMKKEE